MPFRPKPIDITRPVRRPKPPSRWRRASLPVKIAALALGSAVIAAGLGWALLAASPFDDLRRSLAQGLLRHAFDRDVRLDGPLKVALGAAPRVVFSELVIENPDWAHRRNLLRVQRGEVSIRLWPLLSGLVIVPRLVVDGAVLSFETDSRGRSNWQAAGEAREDGRREPGTVPLLEQVSLKDVTVEKLDPVNGWDVELLLDAVETRRDPEGRGKGIAGRGLVNGTPLKIAGRLPAPGRATSPTGPYPFRLSLEASGFALSLDGSIADPEDGKGLDLTLASQVRSLGDLLETMGLTRSLEGHSTLTARLTGDLRRLAVDKLDGVVTTRAGDTVRVAGSMADLWAGTGLALDVRGKIVRPEKPEDGTSLFHDFRLTGFEGKVSGDLRALALEQLHLRSDAIARDLRAIGPIDVAAVKKDDEGRLQLLGIEVLAGPPDRPIFEVKGQVGDLLEGEDVSLAGRFDLETSAVLGLDGDRAREALGRLKGAFRISDADGSLGLEQLDAAVKGTDVLSLTLKAAVDDVPKGDGITLDAALHVPEYAVLAKAAGAEPHAVGTLRFDGRVGGNDEAIRVDGKARVGRTVLSGELTGTLKGDRPSLAGKLASPLLHLGDLRALSFFAAAEARPAERGSPRRRRVPARKQPRKTAEPPALDWLDALDLDLALEIAKIAGGGTAVSNLAGRLKLENGLLSVDPLRVVYLGGRVRASGSVDTRARPTRYRLKGSVDNWRLERLLRELQAPMPVTGRLYMSVDLSARGDTRRAIVGSLGGRFAAAVSRGRIKSTLFKLTGLDLTRWLISRSRARGYTDLNCLIARFNLRNGVGTSTALLLDTTDVLFRGNGTVDLGRDAIDIRVRPSPKVRTILNQVVPFRITGSLADPRVRISGGHAVARTVGSIVLWDVKLLGTLVGLVAGPGRDGGNPCLGKGRRGGTPATSRRRRGRHPGWP